MLLFWIAIQKKDLRSVHNPINLKKVIAISSWSAILFRSFCDLILVFKIRKNCKEIDKITFQKNKLGKSVIWWDNHKCTVSTFFEFFLNGAAGEKGSITWQSFFRSIPPQKSDRRSYPALKKGSKFWKGSDCA